MGTFVSPPTCNALTKDRPAISNFEVIVNVTDDGSSVQTDNIQSSIEEELWKVVLRPLFSSLFLYLSHMGKLYQFSHFSV